MRIPLLFCLTFIHSVVLGQMSAETAKVIETVLLQEKVEEKIFFYYEEERKMRAGNYAFICPNATLRKIYPGISEALANSIETNGLFRKVTFYWDWKKAVYINGVEDNTLQIVFEKILIEHKTASLIFFTTSTKKQELFSDRYVLVEANLQKQNGEWEVERLKVYQIKWVDYFKM